MLYFGLFWLLWKTFSFHGFPLSDRHGKASSSQTKKKEKPSPPASDDDTGAAAEETQQADGVDTEESRVDAADDGGDATDDIRLARTCTPTGSSTVALL